MLLQLHPITGAHLLIGKCIICQSTDIALTKHTEVREFDMLVFPMEHLAEGGKADQFGRGEWLRMKCIRVFLKEVLFGHDHGHIN